MPFLIWLWQVQISSENSSPVSNLYPVIKWYLMQLCFHFNFCAAVKSIIRYQFSESWSDGQKRLVRTTLQNLQAKFHNSCIRFPEIKRSDKIWTYFQNQVVESSRGNRIYLTNDQVEEGSGCFASVGYQGSPNQLLNLDPSEGQLQKIQSGKLFN